VSPPTDKPRLRAKALADPFHVLLVEPEIPQNTGNIARLCAATGCPLHLVGKLGFSLDEHAVRRAGLDYWHLVRVVRHESFAPAIHTLCSDNRASCWFFSAKATRSYLSVPFQAGDVLVFGKESVGLPEALLEEHAEHVVGIPTLGAVRSLNLANTVAIALYEGLRRIGALDRAYTDA
jgi:tRNA (cytidine/uridine-2'-O-)-methyltransferase